MKRTVFLCFLFWIYFQGFGQLSKMDIDNSIDKGILKHPYLYFSEEDKPAMLKRIQNDSECNAIFRRLKAECNMLLHMPVNKNIPVQGKNTRADWTEDDRNNAYESYYNLNRSNAFNLAFLYQLTGEQKYADKAYEFADAFCDLTTWTMRPHEFPVIYSRIMPWNVPDDQVNFNFDHFNGDSGRMMAAVYDWLYNGLNQEQRDRIRGALLEKVVTRVRGDYEFHWWASAYRCNWCGVCNSGVGLAGLTLLTENPQLTDIVAESYNRINSMFNELGVDGGWQEGGGYWNYAIHTSAFFADALKRITKGKYNLFENQRFKNNPATFPLYISLPGKRSVNFEDSGGGSLIGSPHLINKLATETRNPQTAWYRHEFFGEGNDIFDIIWPKPDVVPLAPASPSKHFRSIDWWVMRSDFSDPAKVVVAGKAGMNDDPHHGHLDIGHFVIYWQNDYFIQDKGKEGGYDEKFFDDARWDYVQASSEGHNVIFVNGEKQIPAKMRKQPWKEGVGGKVLLFNSSEKYDYVVMDPTKAYPGKELLGWHRHVIYVKPEVTLVVDEMNTRPGAFIEARFHPGVGFEVKDNFVFLENDKGKMAVIPVTEGNFSIVQDKHASQYVNASVPFAWINYVDTEIVAKNHKTILATLIIPVDNINEAHKIAASKQLVTDSKGSIRITFERKGKELLFNFSAGDDGLKWVNTDLQ